MSEHKTNTSGWCEWHKDYCDERERPLHERIASLEADLTRLQGEHALAKDTAFWLDCQWRNADKSRRGADWCKLEGTKICALCLLADAEAERDRLQGEKAALEREREATKGFGELMRRLYNDLPLLPCPEYSQDVAFVAHCQMSWRKEANKRAKDLDEAHAALAKHHADGISPCPVCGRSC